MTFGQSLRAVWGGSFRLLFSNIPTALKIVWPWMIIVFLVTLFASDEPVRFDEAQMTSEQGLMFLATIAILTVLYALAFSSVAVAWHRHGLLGEEPGAFPIRFRKRELRFLGKGILVALVMVLITLPVVIAAALLGALLHHGGPVMLSVFAIAGLTIYLGVVSIMMRYMLVLPATAIDRDFGLKDAYHHGDGFGRAMALTSIGITLAVMLLSFVLQLGVWGLAMLYLKIAPAPLVPMVSAFAAVLSAFVDAVLYFLSIIAGLAVVTTGYRVAGASRGYSIYGEGLPDTD